MVCILTVVLLAILLKIGSSWTDERCHQNIIKFIFSISNGDWLANELHLADIIFFWVSFLGLQILIILALKGIARYFASSYCVSFIALNKYGDWPSTFNARSPI